MLRWGLAPILLFWLLIAVLIWLFLLHVARIVSGTFSPVEIALTIVMGLASGLGLALCLRIRHPVPVLQGLAIAALALALQICAFAVSIQPWVAHADGHEVSQASPGAGRFDDLA